MIVSTLTKIPILADGWTKIINYEIIRGNEIWRFGIVMLVFMLTLTVGRIVQYSVKSNA